MRGRPELIAAEIGLAQARLQYTRKTAQCRRELADALANCQALQAEIAMLPDAAESAGSVREMAGLCTRLEQAVHTLHALLLAYPEACLDAELYYYAQTRKLKEAAAKAFLQAAKEMKGVNEDGSL